MPGIGRKGAQKLAAGAEGPARRSPPGAVPASRGAAARRRPGVAGAIHAALVGLGYATQEADDAVGSRGAREARAAAAAARTCAELLRGPPCGRCCAARPCTGPSDEPGGRMTPD